MVRKVINVLFVFCLMSAHYNTWASDTADTAAAFFTCDFENADQRSLWQLKNGSCQNKWYIGQPSDNQNYCLFVSSDGKDTSYKSSSTTIVAYTEIDLPSSDSITLEMYLNVGGEGSDYLKAFLAPVDAEFQPNTTKEASGFAGKYYSTNAFKFEKTDNYFINKLKNAEKVYAKAANPAPCSSAKLVFVWRNDNKTEENPAPVIDNIELKARISSINKTLCKGEILTLNNRNVNQAGVYYDTIITDGGCDSIIQYNVTFYDTFVVNKDVEICSDGSYVLDNGTVLTTSGVYTDNMQSVNGCDSIIVINLKVKEVFDTVIYDTVCAGGVYNKYGFSLTQTGSYFDTLKRTNGCDSIVNLRLQVNSAYNITHVDTICNGEIFDKYGFNVSQAGFYTDSLLTDDGCDSIINLNLKVNDTLIADIYDSICFGQIYSQYGFTESESGVYTDSLQSVNGCDSIVILHLTVNPVYVQSADSDTVRICQGESVEFCGKTLTTSGYYEEKMQNIYGCDSIRHITLVVSPVYWTVDSVTIQSGEKYKFNGKTYTQEGVYTDTLTSIGGCDSIVTLHLTVSSSLIEVSGLQYIEIFPNPATTDIEIVMQSSANKEIINITDMTGRLVKTVQILANQSKTRIDVSDLPKGSYILRISDNKTVFERTVIIQ